MSETNELGRRITAAMDRIGRALEQTGATVDAGEVAALKQALDDERLANGQLEERLKAIKDKQEARLAALEAGRAEARAQMAALDDQLQRLRKANELLRENNAALRAANAEGVGEPHLINKAMLAELEGLRASRAADVAEVAAVMGALVPLMNGSDTQGETADA